MKTAGQAMRRLVPDLFPDLVRNRSGLSLTCAHARVVPGTGRDQIRASVRNKSGRAEPGRAGSGKARAVSPGNAQQTLLRAAGVPR